MAYREALHRWAAQHVPKAAQITDVKIRYSEGHIYSEWTMDSPSLYVTISYRTPDGVANALLTDDQEAVELLADMGRLLTELFAIEDAS